MAIGLADHQNSGVKVSTREVVKVSTQEVVIVMVIKVITAKQPKYKSQFTPLRTVLMQK